MKSRPRIIWDVLRWRRQGGGDYSSSSSSLPSSSSPSPSSSSSSHLNHPSLPKPSFPLLPQPFSYNQELSGIRWNGHWKHQHHQSSSIPSTSNIINIINHLHPLDFHSSHPAWPHQPLSLPHSSSSNLSSSFFDKTTTALFYISSFLKIPNVPFFYEVFISVSRSLLAVFPFLTESHIICFSLQSALGSPLFLSFLKWDL